MTRPLEDKVAIVTGASSRIGIGAAVARRLAASGCRLLLVAEGPEDELAEIVAECIALRGGEADGVAACLADLAQAPACSEMVDDALRRWGRVDRLLNNAAVRISKPFGTFTAEEFDLGVAVNLRAAFLASQAVLPAMRQQGGGRIAHIASQFGSVSSPTRALYGLTKAALVHLAKSMALELATENIQVNAVSPGPTATRPIVERERTDPAASADRLRDVPLGRFGRPDEIAETVHWLFTDAPAFLTGHDLIVDGGFTIH